VTVTFLLGAMLLMRKVGKGRGEKMTKTPKYTKSIIFMNHSMKAFIVSSSPSARLNELYLKSLTIDEESLLISDAEKLSMEMLSLLLSLSYVFSILF
jgi:hypothetical protein